MNNHILESVYCGFFAILGYGVHQVTPREELMFTYAHEILQDGAWAISILIGLRALYKEIKKRTKK